MAKITLKNGLVANLPTLTTAEPAYTTDTKKLYVGDETNGNILINPLSEAEATAIQDVINGLGTASTKDIGTAEGNVPILGIGGKLDSSLIPATFVNNVYVIETVAALITLTDAQVGDIAVVTGTSESYALKELPSTTDSNWVKLLFNNAVLSVNSKTGVVSLVGQDILIPNYAIGTSTTILATDNITQALGKLAYADTLLAPLANPTFTGVPNAPTAAVNTNTTQIATTQFVQSQLNAYTTANPGGSIRSVNGITPASANGAITVGAGNINLTGYTAATSYTTPTATMSINTAIANLAYGCENVDGGTF